MKSHIFLLAIMLIFINACADPSYNQSKQAIVVIDITESINPDKLNASIINEDITLAMGLDNSYAGEAIIKLITIDDISGSRSKQVKLSKDEKGNSIMRNKEINSFHAELMKELEQILQSESKKRSSKIMAKLTSVLGNVKQGNEVFIYSDFLENSEWANFYIDKQLQQASTNPEKFFKDNFPHYSLPPMDGVTIHLFALRTPATDIKINHALNFWENLFQSKKAKTIINK